MIQTKLNEAWDKINETTRICMFGGCKEHAIKSHVLQKNGILREISEDNHLITLSPSNAYQLEEGFAFQFKKMGINNVYTFLGFCNKHDTEIFKPIEDKDNLDLYNPYHQALFSYRGLCQEIRRKEISIEWIDFLKNTLPVQLNNRATNPLRDGYIEGVKNLSFFKQEFEKSIILQCFDNFSFSTIELPKIELCISVPLNIREPDLNPNNLPYEIWKQQRIVPFATSFVNLIPMKKSTYFIGGFHHEFPCQWTLKLINKLKRAKSKIVIKELSDLVVLRLEFWAMSPRLFRSIPENILRKYKQTFTDNIFSHSEKLETKINLFEKH